MRDLQEKPIPKRSNHRLAFPVKHCYNDCVKSHGGAGGNRTPIVGLEPTPMPYMARPHVGFAGGPGGIRTRVDRAITMVFQAITFVRSCHRPKRSRGSGSALPCFMHQVDGGDLLR